MISPLAYYPGCSLQSTEREYDISLRLVATTLGQTLEEIPDWLCCGATSAHSIDRPLATALAGDTLAKARQNGHSAIFAPCAMCYARLATILHEIKGDPHRALALEKALKCEGRDLASLRVLGILDWLREFSDNEILAPLKKRFQGLRVACYYGCLLVRPQNITRVDNAEEPRDLERIARLLGAEPVPWSMATSCCGAGFSLSDKPSVFRLGRQIVESAQRAGAQAIIVACPMCHTNLDMRQMEYQPSSSRVPAVFVTQMLGLAYGLSPASLGLPGNFISPAIITDSLAPVQES